jgi:hypothetical protein
MIAAGLMPTGGGALPNRSGTSRRWIRFRHAVAACAVLMLSLPASDLVRTGQSNLRISSSLRQLGRYPPDTSRDLANRELTRFLPPTGQVGFLNVSGRDATQTWFFLQYSLAPRTLVPSIDHEFVIEFGAREAAGLSGDTRFRFVKAFANDLRVFRRVSQ